MIWARKRTGAKAVVLVVNLSRSRVCVFGATAADQPASSAHQPMRVRRESSETRQGIEISEQKPLRLLEVQYSSVDHDHSLLDLQQRAFQTFDARSE